MIDPATSEIKFISEFFSPLLGTSPVAWVWEEYVASSMFSINEGVSVVDVEDGGVDLIFPAVRSPGERDYAKAVVEYYSVDHELAFAKRQRVLYVFRTVTVLGQAPKEFRSMRQIRQALDSLRHKPSVHGGNPPLLHFGLLCRVDSVGNDTVVYVNDWYYSRGLSVIGNGSLAALSDGEGITIVNLATGEQSHPMTSAMYRTFAPQFTSDGHALAAIGWREEGANAGTSILVAESPSFAGFSEKLDLTAKWGPYWLDWSEEGRWIIISGFAYGRGHTHDELDLNLIEVATGTQLIVRRPYRLKGKPIPDLVPAFPSGHLEWR